MFNFIEISTLGTKLSVENECLKIQVPDGTAENLALNDLDALVIANPAISLSGSVLSECGMRRIPVVFCNRTFAPVAVLTPICLEGAEGSRMLDAQLNASLPLKKQLWKCLVSSKISGQSQVLLKVRKDDALEKYTKMVTSGDSGNIEGLASKIYWKNLALFSRRDRAAPDANAFFNYAYALLYSAFARNICASALNPHLGIHHHNKYNPFCLASDLLEPYRPCADTAVISLIQNKDSEQGLNRENKSFLIQKIYDSNVLLGKSKTNVFNAIRKTVLSFKQCLFKKSSGELLVPNWNEGILEL